MLQCVPQGFLKPGASARFRMDSSGGKNASSGFPTETIGDILFFTTMGHYEACRGSGGVPVPFGGVRWSHVWLNVKISCISRLHLHLLGMFAGVGRHFSKLQSLQC